MLLDSFTKYEDEFGEIEAEVLREAQNLWKYSRNLALRMLGDEQKGQMFLMKAAAKVSAKLREKDSKIESLPAYLFETFRRLVIAEAKKRSLHRKLEEKYLESLEELFQRNDLSEEEKIYQRILIAEIEAKMDDWTRKVFRYRALGYEFKDLVAELKTPENSIRAIYSKKIKKLAASLDEN